MRTTPRLGAVLLALVLAAALSGQRPGEAPGQSAGKLDGAWTAVSAERDGKPAQELRGHTLTFARDTFVIHGADGKVVYRGTYKVDAAKKAAHIDVRHTEGELKGKTWLGVYTLGGDTLVIADNAVDMTKPRPTRLATKSDSGYVRLSFKRSAP
jgi:uncharacterized protein (TIGR03067 family)